MRIRSFFHPGFAHFFLLLFSLGITNIGFGQEKPLELHEVRSDLVIFTTYSEFEGVKYAANGSYMVTDNGVIMFDTPWDSTQYQPLIDSIKEKHGKPILAVFATHWHADRAGGFAYYNKVGIPTYATSKTNALLAENNYSQSTHTIELGKYYTFGNQSFTVYFPGVGHSTDNVVIWLPKQKILHGGCFIKSESSKTIGFVGDGNVKEWKPSLARLVAKFPDVEMIIPGHDAFEGTRHIENSNLLIEKYLSEK